MNHSLLHCITLRTPSPPDVAVSSDEGKKLTRVQFVPRVRNKGKTVRKSASKLYSAEELSRISRHLISTNKSRAESGQQCDRIT